ncbi:Phytochrome-associated serine/threonine-protein phosphatase 1 [Camellia lanceoleosa]|uniref:Phytochrome-associated serine/threonine-protein phosphatase 1 n=1 Tax=Camellia lanceoleosa TaxID=1840588 RepID=A0ACC0IV37_9ERIC|nr:Phytochrome-associated serine/threonine-protein phosphatase 1 [Camellia lanceoleosa]
MHSSSFLIKHNGKNEKTIADIYDDVKNEVKFFTETEENNQMRGPRIGAGYSACSEAINFVRNQLRQHGDVQLVSRLEKQLW